MPKRRKLLDAGGPIEDDETARQKMRNAEVYKRGVENRRGDYDGFDPDNVGGVRCFFSSGWGRSICRSGNMRAMSYFARLSDLPMLRWLYINGAGTRNEDVAVNFPMFLAANIGHLDVCKWLFDHGAAKDIKRRTRENPGRSPIYATFSTKRPQQRDLNRWLILKGALCKDDNSGDLDVETMKRDLNEEEGHRTYCEERKLLLEWANDLHRPRTSFFLFLSGALSTPQHAYRTRRSSSPVRILSGKSGTLELIGDYVGFVRGREARIIRQLTELLPDVNKDLDSK